MSNGSLINHGDTYICAQPTLWQRSFLFIFICFLIAYRQPAVLTEQRFWAEEGTYFFPYALSHGWFDTVIHVVPLFGFYSLAHNIAGLFATLVPLEQAPFVTTYLGFLSHLLPCCIVIVGNSPFWNTLPKKTLICLGILLFPFGRMWLNTTYVHFTLALSVFLILLEEMEHSSRLIKNLYRTIILIAGLSGAVSCFLTPVYLLKAWRSRRKENILQASLLAFVSAVQVAVFMYTITKLDPNAQTRFLSFGYDKLWSIIYFQFGIPFFGVPYFNSEIIKSLDFRAFYMAFPKVYSYLGRAMVLSNGPVYLVSLSMVIAYALFVFIKQIRDKFLQLPAISFLLMFVLSSAGSMNMRGGQRYAYIPCVIMLVMFLTEFYNEHNGVLRKSLAALFITLMLLSNSYGYRKGTEICTPKWVDEIRIWQKDHNYKIKIWPYYYEERWEIMLTSKLEVSQPERKL